MDTREMIAKAMEFGGSLRAKLILSALLLDVTNELTDAERKDAMLAAYNALQFELDSQEN